MSGKGKLAEALRAVTGQPPERTLERPDKGKSLYLRALHLEIEAQMRRRLRGGKP